tara:strand:- start:1176 stop:2096 length:921 start_codon:yes stop_codon:yes gene_type:complete
MAYSPQGEQGLSRAQVRASKPIVDKTIKDVPNLVNDRIAPFLRSIGALNPFTAPLVIPRFYGQGMMEAALDAQKRGSRIPGLPELGLSEAGSSLLSQLGADLKATVSGGGNTAEIQTAPETAPKPQRFDNTLEGQYQRYFKTPEFDNVFGAGARGEGAPKDAAAMQALGSQLQAPSENTNIASMYAAQSAMGRVNQDAIQDYFADADLPGNVKLEGGGTALQAWARENPMLAQRLYEKNRPRIEDNPATDTGTAVRGETPGTLKQQIEYGAGSPVSKSPTELDIFPATEEEFEKEFLKTQLGKYFT